MCPTHSLDRESEPTTPPNECPPTEHARRRDGACTTVTARARYPVGPVRRIGPGNANRPEPEATLTRGSGSGALRFEIDRQGYGAAGIGRVALCARPLPNCPPWLKPQHLAWRLTIAAQVLTEPATMRADGGERRAARRGSHDGGTMPVLAGAVTELAEEVAAPAQTRSGRSGGRTCGHPTNRRPPRSGPRATRAAVPGTFLTTTGRVLVVVVPSPS